ncbi:MAG TPA: hypothetical protein VMW16_02860 [Sedimentisphaerales bacterium]|nr:hypothetical protein [Sedimentisphaerales bacterium]
MCRKQRKQEWATYYWPQGKKLLFLKEEATPEYRSRQWRTEELKKARTIPECEWYSHILRKYLPRKNSRVLEGGCGHLVDAMGIGAINLLVLIST